MASGTFTDQGYVVNTKQPVQEEVVIDTSPCGQAAAAKTKQTQTTTPTTPAV